MGRPESCSLVCSLEDSLNKMVFERRKLWECPVLCYLVRHSVNSSVSFDLFPRVQWIKSESFEHGLSMFPKVFSLKVSTTALIPLTHDSFKIWCSFFPGFGGLAPHC